MDPGDLFDKDRFVFARDNYRCLMCNSRKPYEDLWVMYHDDRPITGCSECAEGSIDSVFGEEEKEQETVEEGVRFLVRTVKALLDMQNTR